MFFSATEKKGRLVKSPVAMHTFHIFFYACDLPPIFSFSHSTVSRIVLLSGLGV